MIKTKGFVTVLGFKRKQKPHSSAKTYSLPLLLEGW